MAVKGVLPAARGIGGILVVLGLALLAESGET